MRKTGLKGEVIFSTQKCRTTLIAVVMYAYIYIVIVIYLYSYFMFGPFCSLSAEPGHSPNKDGNCNKTHQISCDETCTYILASPVC